MGKVTFTEAELASAAIKNRKKLLMIPILGLAETAAHMTGRPGIRYAERVGELVGDAQFAPYNPKNRTDLSPELKTRLLKTYFGSVVADFEPNSVVSTIYGSMGATKGDGQMKTPVALDVLALVAKRLGYNLNAHIWDAKRNDSGKKTVDLFDGFDTITAQEITAGNIATDKKNLIEIDAVTSDNAVEVAKAIVSAMSPELRAQNCNLYCSYEFLDLYNANYQKVVGAVPYNQQYENQYVEGSGKRLKFVPLSNKAGSSFLHASPAENMLLGYDQMSDDENVLVKEYDPFVLSYVATMFFGTQFESIDPRRLIVAKIGAKAAGGKGDTGDTTDSKGEGGSDAGSTGTESQTE